MFQHSPTQRQRARRGRSRTSSSCAHGAAEPRERARRGGAARARRDGERRMGHRAADRRVRPRRRSAVRGRGRTQGRAPASPAASPGSPPALRYRLASRVPSYWVPLLPVKTDAGLRLWCAARCSTSRERRARSPRWAGSSSPARHYRSSRRRCRARAPASPAAISGRDGPTARHISGSVAARASGEGRARATCALMRSTGGSSELGPRHSS